MQRLGRLAAQGQQVVQQPVGQRAFNGRGRFGQQQADGFGQVAHGFVAFVEQPFGQAGRRARLLAQHARGHQLARFAAGEKVHGPRRIGRRRGAQVVLQCGLLGQAGRAGVERAVEGGEGVHRLCLRRLIQRKKCCHRLMGKRFQLSKG